MTELHSRVHATPGAWTSDLQNLHTLVTAAKAELEHAPFDKVGTLYYDSSVNFVTYRISQAG
jgi:hypothetical protein